MADIALLQAEDPASETENDQEAVRPNRLETITISIGSRKFVTASRTMLCIPGSYFWLIMNPGRKAGPKFEHDVEVLELGPGPGEMAYIQEMTEFVHDSCPLNLWDVGAADREQYYYYSITIFELGMLTTTSITSPIPRDTP